MTRSGAKYTPASGFPGSRCPSGRGGSWDGIVHYTCVECAREGPAGFGDMPSEQEVLAHVRAL
jgi:hypothetical protein